MTKSLDIFNFTRYNETISFVLYSTKRFVHLPVKAHKRWVCKDRLSHTTELGLQVLSAYLTKNAIVD